MNIQDLQAASGSSTTATQSGPPEKGLMVAAKFWEPRRLLYNLLLFAVVVIWVVKSWPHWRGVRASQNHVITWTWT